MLAATGPAADDARPAMSDLARAAALAADGEQQRGDGGPGGDSDEDYDGGDQLPFSVEDIPTSRRSGDHARALSATEGHAALVFEKNGVSI